MCVKMALFSNGKLDLVFPSKSYSAAKDKLLSSIELLDGVRVRRLFLCTDFSATNYGR
jgi:hypothetical protein